MVLLGHFAPSSIPHFHSILLNTENVYYHKEKKLRGSLYNISAGIFDVFMKNGKRTGMISYR